MLEPIEPFGPIYPALTPTVQKFRRMARNGLSDLPKETRRAYSAAVSEAIRALQRSELARILPGRVPHCASRTAHTTGKAIHKAVREQQRAALLACPGQIRRSRSPEWWCAAYETAMREKRARQGA